MLPSFLCLCLARHSIHALHEIGVAEHASRLKKVHLDRQLVDCRIPGGELIECFPELEPALEIYRALTLSPGKSEVRDSG